MSIVHDSIESREAARVSKTNNKDNIKRVEKQTVSVDETLKQRNADSESDRRMPSYRSRGSEFSEFRLSWGCQGPHHQELSNSIDFKPEPVKARGLQKDEMHMPARAIIRARPPQLRIILDDTASGYPKTVATLAFDAERYSGANVSKDRIEKKHLPSQCLGTRS
ncbi:hypothetical protein NA56DRAFT_704075 [Hyaloscypha hepaticicola]|uniref:Uncharacterized protein n=1 Tax=Hyaloscypha hepaticicola TaxID=2082293 RepID=A0A2J6Q3R0_9HELO|nr:hypothetical protein NA56DRAFT_704075 [Hyaloscypha hepaticicola]